MLRSTCSENEALPPSLQHSPRRQIVPAPTRQGTFLDRRSHAIKRAMTTLADYLQTSINVLAATQQQLDPQRVENAIARIVAALAADKPLLVCGNGGSAADAM